MQYFSSDEHWVSNEYGLKLRDAIDSDLVDILKIYNATIPGRRVTADTSAVTLDSRREWFAAHSAEHYPLWVIAGENGLAAWLSFQPFYGRPAYAATAELSIYVAEDARNRGIGSAFLKTAMARAPKLGIRTLLAFIFVHNQPSLSLFKKEGFTQWGLLPGVALLEGTERDLAIYGLRLP